MSDGALAIDILRLDEIGIDAVIGLGAAWYPAGHDARRREYLDWLYKRNPAGEGRLVTAVEGGLLIGMMGLVPLRIRNGEDLFTANMVVNVLSHPEHRTKGLFVKLIRVARRRCDERGEWMIGHPNDAAYPGWKRTRMAFQPGYDLRWMPPLLRIGGKRGTTMRGAQIASLDFDPLAQWQRQIRQPVIAADAPFIAWRFLRHPTRAYHVGVLRSGSEVLGYWVRRTFRPMVDWIVDWQGEQCWKEGPPSRMLRLSVLAWPHIGDGGSQAARWPARSFGLPRVRKHYRFFATPPAGATGVAGWEYLTLAATDFG